MIRKILHIDMDAFFVSVEQAINPSLKGRPVIVGGDPKRRGVVAAASYEARASGVRAGMPTAMAMRLCPDAVFIRGDPWKYSLVSREVFRILRQYSPLVEPVSIDEAYMDLCGFDRLYGPAIDLSQKIQRELYNRLSLVASFGLSTNKLVSKVASGYGKPGGIVEVFPGYEASFLAPLPIERLPGVGKKTLEKLRAFNVKTIGALAQIDVDLLEKTFGNTGRILHERAMGIDRAPVLTEEASPRSIGREVTFERDTLDRDYLEQVLYGLVEKLGQALRRGGMTAKTVTVKLRYSDFTTISRSATIQEPTALDREIFSVALALLERAYTRRIRVRLIGVSVSNLKRGALQLPLIDLEGRLRWCRLYEAIDRIRDRYGSSAMKMGRVATSQLPRLQ
ncbi:MAG: DNA polymerase IV [Candidatus Bathyarchaeia archaeon]